MSNEPGIGFPLNDHQRVSSATLWVEQHRDDRPVAEDKTRAPRGPVRVMLLEEVNGYGNTPNPARGDIGYAAAHILANVTRPIDQTMRAADYVVRCVTTDQDVASRTWQLRVIDPARGRGVLTAPIREHATSAEVAAAINATGCPPCTVIGDGDMLLDDAVQRAWPPRQWHIFWPDGDWALSTTRWVTDTILEYVPGAEEVSIALYQTTFEPTPFVEYAYLPYPRNFATPTAGTYAMCVSVHGRGLVIIDMECWAYVDN